MVAVHGAPSNNLQTDVDADEAKSFQVKSMLDVPEAGSVEAITAQFSSHDTTEEEDVDDYLHEMRDPNNPENPNHNLGDITAYGDGYYESLSSHENFIIADGYGPDRWGCSFRDTQVHEMKGYTKITIGKDSDRKPYSCGELIWRQEDLTYGRYSIDMIASNVVGHVTSFFLIANGDTEIDVEITGLKSNVLWCNIWHGGKQNPVSITLPFETHAGWHNYAFEWRKHGVTWYVDGNMVFNRSDVPTTSPDKTSYKVAINSWTQVNPEVNIEWAGKFIYPKDRVPEARFRNFRYTP
ncbi:hypothetical protein BGZ73_000614 [Actinomortierella ambigua]|nr:hypothetical protein BGZ73_000614 [Actinomortierella ambigua]